MDYIKTHPPVIAADIEDLIERLKSVKTPTIDGPVLSNLVRACHEFALKKSELIDLSVGDVAKGGMVGDVMSISENKVNLSDQAKEMLQNHIDYLNKNGYRLYPTSPLFPTGKKARYTEKTLDNHLKRAQNVKIEETI